MGIVIEDITAWVSEIDYHDEPNAKVTFGDGRVEVIPVDSDRHRELMIVCQEQLKLYDI